MESLEKLLKNAEVEIGQDFRYEKLTCKACNEPLEKDVILFGKLKRVVIACSCTRHKEEENRQEEEKRDRLQRLREVFRDGLIKNGIPVLAISINKLLERVKETRRALGEVIR